MALTSIWQWSTSAASNTDVNSIDISGATGLVKNGDNAIREIMAQIASSEAKGSNVPSATTTTLGTGRFFHITGTTTITDIDFTDAVDGRWAVLEFDGALTLTHNATTLTLPGGANITTAAGDRAFIVQDSGDNVHVLFYQPYATVPGSGITRTNFPIAVFTPLHNQPPATNYATLSTRNSEPVLQFDTTTQEGAVFGGVMPYNYNNGSIRVTIWASLTSATTGTLGWVAAFENMNGQDTDSDGFASDQTGTAAIVPGTSGQPMTHQITFTQAQADSVAAGDAFRLRIRRDVANDTAAGDAELIRVLVEMV